MNKLHSLYKNKDLLLIGVLGVVILLPKLSFIQVIGTTTDIRIEDFLLAAIYLIWIAEKIFGKEKFHFTLVHKLMMLFIVIASIGTIWGIINGTVQYHLLGILNILRRVEYFLMFFVAYDWLKPKRLFRYIEILIAYSVGTVLVGLLQYINLLPMFPSWAFPGRVLYYKQFSFLLSTFGGHYDFGGFLILIAPITIATFFLVKQMYTRLGLLLLIGLYYFSLVNSFSRSAYIGFMIGLVVLFILIRKYILVLLPVLDTLRVAYLYFTGQFSKYDYSITFTPASESPSPSPSLIPSSTLHTHKPTPTPTLHPITKPKLNVGEPLQLPSGGEVTLDPGGAVRVVVWKNAWDHFLKSPLLGTGYTSIGTGSDNQYLRTLAETGILGLGTFLIIVGTVLYKLYKGYKYFAEGTLEKMFIAALIAGIIGILCEAVLIDIFDSSKIAIFLWFLVGLGMVIIYHSHEKVQK